jgi:hypothetical protein
VRSNLLALPAPDLFDTGVEARILLHRGHGLSRSRIPCLIIKRAQRNFRENLGRLRIGEWTKLLQAKLLGF